MESARGKIVHVANIKGGVGKSTIATNLAACLSLRGRTLVVDLDMQGSSTYALGREPVETGLSSAELFLRRFRSRDDGPPLGQANRRTVKPVSGLGIPVAPNLDLLPASPSLMSLAGRSQIRRLTENLELIRRHYSYIVVDTPSVWNQLIIALFCSSDLNLIPVTLSALSTRSLKDYLKEIRRMIRRNPALRIRIIKNEVYGQKTSLNPGKLQTLSENRAYLNSLCELVRYSSGQSTVLLPQSVLFDLEIPDHTAIQTAQDRGVPVALEKTPSSALASFELLTQKVLEVLDRLPNRPFIRELSMEPALSSGLRWAAAIAGISLVLFSSRPLRDPEPVSILCSQQLERNPNRIFSHTFAPGENMYRFAKFAIDRYRAVVPSNEQVETYVNETIDIHNLSRSPGEPFIEPGQRNLAGLTVTFYPPGRIRNPQFSSDNPVYRFFLEQVQDEFAYTTGVWCEYGEGGGRPHQGIDIAAKIGSPVTTPVAGTAYIRKTQKGGNMVGVAKEDYVIFFAHLQNISVSEGQAVSAGDVVGTVGMTGNTSGPHVHIGYGIRFPMATSIRFGRTYFQATDPKQLFFRLMYNRRAV